MFNQSFDLYLFRRSEYICRALPCTTHWRCPHAYRLEGKTDTRTHAQEDVVTHVGRVGGTRLEEWRWGVVCASCPES